MSGVIEAEEGEEACVECGKLAIVHCEDCDAPLCEDHISHEYEDVDNCKDKVACESRL